MCSDCGLLYRDFGLDITLPDDQWLMIHPEGLGGLLCANCIVKRASKLKGSIAVRAIIELIGTSFCDFRDEIEERYKENPTGCGNSFDEILCYEIHHGSDGEHEGGLTFRWLAKKWGISLSFLGELINDHCKRL